MLNLWGSDMNAFHQIAQELQVVARTSGGDLRSVEEGARLGGPADLKMVGGGTQSLADSAPLSSAQAHFVRTSKCRTPPASGCSFTSM